MKIRTGVVSVTFRALSPERIVALAKEAELDAIEWGGDVHVPPGNFTRAREVGARTRDAGLSVLSYGSYYRAGVPGVSFKTVLDTALALGAPNIRIWAGDQASSACDAAERTRIVEEIRFVATVAGSAGVRISLERHGGTLTDSLESTRSLLEELAHRNLFTYWQPGVDLEHQVALEELHGLLPWLSNVHVFEWASGTERLPLARGAERWRRYLGTVASSGCDHAALLEFVSDDTEAAFLEDAAVLRELLNGLY